MDPNQNQQVQTQVPQQPVNPQSVPQQGLPPLSQPIQPIQTPNVPNDSANKKSLFLIVGIIMLVAILVFLTLIIVFRSAKQESTLQQQSTLIPTRIPSATSIPTPTPSSEEEKEVQSIMIEDPTADTA